MKKLVMVLIVIFAMNLNARDFIKFSSPYGEEVTFVTNFKEFIKNKKNIKKTKLDKDNNITTYELKNDIKFVGTADEVTSEISIGFDENKKFMSGSSVLFFSSHYMVKQWLMSYLIKDQFKCFFTSDDVKIGDDEFVYYFYDNKNDAYTMIRIFEDSPLILVITFDSMPFMLQDKLSGKK